MCCHYSADFGDKMRQSVFQVTQYVQGHISSVFPFSVGEILLILAALLLVGAFILLICGFVKLCRKKMPESRKDRREAGSQRGRTGVAGRYFYVLAWIVGVVVMIMSIIVSYYIIAAVSRIPICPQKSGSIPCGNWQFSEIMWSGSAMSRRRRWSGMKTAISSMGRIWTGDDLP